MSRYLGGNTSIGPVLTTPTPSPDAPDRSGPAMPGYARSLPMGIHPADLEREAPVLALEFASTLETIEAAQPSVARDRALAVCRRAIDELRALARDLNAEHDMARCGRNWGRDFVRLEDAQLEMLRNFLATRDELRDLAPTVQWTDPSGEAVMPKTPRPVPPSRCCECGAPATSRVKVAGEPEVGYCGIHDHDWSSG